MFEGLQTFVSHPIFHWIGFIWLLKISHGLLSDAHEGFLLYVWSLVAPSRDFVTDFGQWAVVTGGSDGIGKCVALELAAKGMNIFVLSNVENDLKAVCKEIEIKFRVKTKWHCVDFSDLTCYDGIKPLLDDLGNIGVLVNNVGMMNEDLSTVPKQTEAFIKKIVTVNVAPIAVMSRLVVPKMIEKRKGLILNLGSITAHAVIPGAALYTGTKSFVRKFSECFLHELKSTGVRVCCLEPGFVKTGLITRHPNCRYLVDELPFLIATPQTFVKSVVRVLNVKTPLFFSGYWIHALHRYAVYLLGDAISLWGVQKYLPVRL